MRWLHPINLNHLLRLSDEVGILQFAPLGIPDPASGYAIDDNARALVAATRLPPHPLRERLAKVYLGFLLYAQREDGHFHHLVAHDRSRADIRASDDGLGRCMWACGETVASDLSDSMKQTAKFILRRAWTHLQSMGHVRGWANATLGLATYYKATGHAEARAMTVHLADLLVAALRAHSDGRWTWFEDVLTYEPGRLPLALLHAFAVTGNDRYRDSAEQALTYLVATLHLPLSPNGDGTRPARRRVFWPIGNRGWFPRTGSRAYHDQQPVDAGSMIEAYTAAAAVTGRREYRQLAREAFDWFLGANSCGHPLYDPHSGACFDGLQPGGINRNQGAEATIAYLLARLALSFHARRVTRWLAGEARRAAPLVSLSDGGDQAPGEPSPPLQQPS